jgi:hypothetical protein
MTKLDLLKPGGSRALQLTRLAREINDCEDGVTVARDKTIEMANACYCDGALQGGRLIQVKKFIGHGHFLPWLAKHCQKISPRMASSYMLAAVNGKRVSDLNGGAHVSLRAVMAFASAEENPTKANANGLPPKSWPAYIEALGKWAKFARYVARHPIAAWPVEGRDKLKGDLLPVAAALWPEKFA